MITRAYNPILHFDDEHGHPLAGGLLCTYLAGTSTPVKTYKDESGSFNETQVHLDSRGECEVWLDAAVSYKFIVLNKFGAVVQTFDHVTATAPVSLISGFVAKDADIPQLTPDKAGTAYYFEDGNVVRIWDGTKWGDGFTMQGPKGEQGEPGPKGEQGEPGPKGEDAELTKEIILGLTENTYKNLVEAGYTIVATQDGLFKMKLSDIQGIGGEASFCKTYGSENVSIDDTRTYNLPISADGSVFHGNDIEILNNSFRLKKGAYYYSYTVMLDGEGMLDDIIQEVAVSSPNNKSVVIIDRSKSLNSRVSISVAGIYKAVADGVELYCVAQAQQPCHISARVYDASVFKIVSSGDSSGQYESGEAIFIDAGKINVNVGKGLEVGEKNKLQIKLGKGLKFNEEEGVEGTLSLDDVTIDVVEDVIELGNELDKKITTTFNYAQIKSMDDFAVYGATNTTRIVGQLFAVPISNEVRIDDTLICIRAKQSYAGKVSFGIFEFDFDGNEGSGSTTWLCDTGAVSVQEGENQFPVRHIIPKSAVRPVIKMEPGKLYYATVMIAGDAPATGLFLASCEPYDQNYNATPKYTMVVSNMDGFVDWSVGTQRNTWFQGYNEYHEVPRLFMMIRNGETAPVPTTEPFNNVSSYSLEHSYRIENLFNLQFNVANQPLLYQKIRPTQDCNITKIGWVDYHSGATYDYANDVPLIIDSNYTSLTKFGDNVETESTKRDDGYYYHEYQLSQPLQLKADTNYFVPCNTKIKGNDEWIITYREPTGMTKDLILFDSKYNVASWAGYHAEYLAGQPGTACFIVTDDGKRYTF